MNKPKKFNLYEHHNIFDEDILLSYKGPFDDNILSVIGSYLKVIINKNPLVSKKLFRIFIEIAQNISYYSAEKNSLQGKKNAGVGTIIIGEFEDHYSVVTGNAVELRIVEQLINKCDVINSLDRESLRKYKREQRNLPQGEKGGANIGLIQVALTSANPLDIEITPIDDKSAFFSLCVKIAKRSDQVNEQSK